MSRNNRRPARPCPQCGYVADCDSEAFGRTVAPKPGDVAICLKCGMCEVFLADKSRRPLTFDEFEALEPMLRVKIRVIERARSALMGTRN